MTAHPTVRSPELPDTDVGLADLGELTRLEGTPAPELQRINRETHRLAEWALIDMGSMPEEQAK